jgi:hypothetical protein
MLDGMKQRAQAARMKEFAVQTVGLAICALLSSGFSAVRAADTNPPPRLTVELKDGSRVVGTSIENSFRFHSALLKDLKLAVKDVRTIECASSNTATLITVNGDKLMVSFLEAGFAVETSFGKVKLPAASVRKVTVSGTTAAGSTELINVDFGSGGARGYSSKTGAAALGQENDFWNYYDRDMSSDPYNWRRSGTLSNLKRADKETTAVTMNVSDAAGAWNDDSSDPMYKTFVYPLDSRDNNVVTFTGLAPGDYDVLAYAPDGDYEVSVGGTSYGVKRNRESPVSPAPVWKEGVQYARWRNIPVAEGDTLMLTVRTSPIGHAVLAGVQITITTGE